jgi:ankyrin repeat protein
MVKLLIAKGANVNMGGQNRYFGDCTPLRAAIEQGHADIAEMLISGTADVNAQDEEHMTPLHRAARLGMDR